MQSEQQAAKDTAFSSSFAAPTISLPKGGGAIRGMGEKFAANPVSGTGALNFPVYTSPGRSGFGPKLALSYNSGSGNSPFGFGWDLDLPCISRKTDKGLPQYLDEDESDTFILSGAEDLVPQLNLVNNQWVRDGTTRTNVFGGKTYFVRRYRPRVEGLFARIERWTNLSEPQDTFWRSISKDNVTTWYGKTAESRISDPADPSRIFSWLICESYDDKGNVIRYQYKEEDSAGVDLSQAHERNRSDATRSAQHYIKYVFYGNRTPYFPDLTAPTPVALPTDWCFQLVFDYGEHDLAAPVAQDSGQPWGYRPDPFSTYRSTFEVRTYRLCRRVLMFHHFAEQPNIGINCLVRSTDLVHSFAPASDPSQPFYSYLLSVTQTGYVRNPAGGYFSNSLPPLQFEYTQAEIDETVRDLDSESLKNLPNGIDGSRYRWVDLDGEGVSGILSEQGGSWFYKPNLSPANQQTVDGQQLTLPRFGAVQPVARQPSLASLSSGRQQLMDLSGDGQLDLVQFDGPTPGFFERTDEADWEPFRAFCIAAGARLAQSKPEVHRPDRRRLPGCADHRGRRVPVAHVAGYGRLRPGPASAAVLGRGERSAACLRRRQRVHLSGRHVRRRTYRPGARSQRRSVLLAKPGLRPFRRQGHAWTSRRVRPRRSVRRTPHPAGRYRRLRNRRHHLLRQRRAFTCTSISPATPGVPSAP